METFYSYNQLTNLVPVKRPRLMLDRLAVDDQEGTARATKAISIDEQLFLGHFPGNPIFPGVLQVAAMLQTTKGIIGQRDGLEAAEKCSLTAAKKIKFRAPVNPGDLLEIKTAIKEENNDSLIADCSTLVKGKTTCQAVLTISRQQPQALELSAATFAPDLHNPRAGTMDKPMDVNSVMERIPHRYPFLFIDRILLMDETKHRIVALKNVTGNEPFFAGQSPAVLPSYVQAEIAAQTGCTLALSEPGNENKLAVFMSIDNCNFYSPVLPGDQLLVDVNVTPRGRFGKGHGDLYVGDRKVSDIDLKFAIVDPQE